MKFLSFATVVLLLLIPCEAATKANLYQQLEDKIANNEYKKITSVLVNQNGKPVYEHYFNGANKQTLHNIRSASKSITAILFGIAMEKGLFNSEMDAVLPVFKHKQPIRYPNEKKRAMNFQDLMTMTSILECNDWEPISMGNEERMYLREDWVEFALDLPNRGVRPWETPAAERPFGKAFSYCTAGVVLVGAAIEQKSRMGLDKFAATHLLSPMGIKNVKWTYSPLGITQAGGGLEITSADLLKVGEMMLNDGKFNNRQLVSSRWMKTMLTERVVGMPEMNVRYGYLWWIFDFEVDGKNVTAYAAAGNGGNYLWMVPSLNLSAVITSQAFNTKYMHKQSQEIFSNYILKSINESIR